MIKYLINFPCTSQSFSGIVDVGSKQRMTIQDCIDRMTSLQERCNTWERMFEDMRDVAREFEQQRNELRTKYCGERC